ncbi:hypothetical protein KSP35_21170 [Aquihabitans sp. G128]|uniref:hypothetical protein n=1 Tax=Aquihabitans sp. G128 TaxID=2849779 RepID=UPI001C21E39B|nr:hypothetical protein [Aquihabitans sp. G128]QXC60803.1 hypothetical protein KSP35_21170 [Aquihabitans sp. G128]
MAHEDRARGVGRGQHLRHAGVRRPPPGRVDVVEQDLGQHRLGVGEPGHAVGGDDVAGGHEHVERPGGGGEVELGGGGRHLQVEPGPGDRCGPPDQRDPGVGGGGEVGPPGPGQRGEGGAALARGRHPVRRAVGGEDRRVAARGPVDRLHLGVGPVAAEAQGHVAHRQRGQDQPPQVPTGVGQAVERRRVRRARRQRDHHAADGRVERRRVGQAARIGGARAVEVVHHERGDAEGGQPLGHRREEAGPTGTTRAFDHHAGGPSARRPVEQVDDRRELGTAPHRRRQRREDLLLHAHALLTSPDAEP